MFAKKEIFKNYMIYIFEKPLIMPFQICKKEKLKMFKFPLTGCFQKICNFFFTKLVQFVSLCQRLSEKLNYITI